MSYAPTEAQIQSAFEIAKERYAAFGVDVDKTLSDLKKIAISLHCWQGDDVVGFEDPDRGLSGGIMATGNYPGKARSVGELRSDLDKAYSLIPGTHRLTYMLFIWIVTRLFRAMTFNQRILLHGWIGQKRTITVLILIRLVSRIH